MIKLHTVLPPAAEAGFLGEEPTFSTPIPDTKYNLELTLALAWHNNCASDKDYQKYMEQWIREHRASSAKKDIEAFRKLPYINKTLCSLARVHLQGFPLNSRDAQRIRDYVMEFTGIVKKEDTISAPVTPKVKNAPSIQDRIRAQVSSVLSDLDVYVDDAFDGNLPDLNEMAGKILTQNFKGPQLKLVQQYLRRNLAEWHSAYNNEDEQLAEGYSYVGKRNFKKIIDAFSEVMARLSQEHTKVNSTRIRKKKPVDKKKMASKIRFMAEFEGIKSCTPVDIIGANMVWVYDTQKRRLGYYEAELKDSLYVKGPKIYGYKNTCEKILRKPDEQLSEVLKLRKNQTVNWFDTIKAKCKTMKGRTHSNLLILRID
jgi:hypothetical protein